jgi:hypothetical protein
LEKREDVGLAVAEVRTDADKDPMHGGAIRVPGLAFRQ